MSAADTLRRAAELVEQAVAETTAKGYEYAGIGDRGDEWAALLTVPVAGPLAAWLRVEAEMAENPLCALVEGAATPIVARVPATARPFALALARAILGEASPLPAGKDGLDEKNPGVDHMRSVRLVPGQKRTVPGTRILVEYARPAAVFVLWELDDAPPVDRLLLDSSAPSWQPVVLGGEEWEVAVQHLSSFPEIDVHVRPRSEWAVEP